MQTKQDILDFCDSFGLPLKEDIQTLWDLGFDNTRASALNQTTGEYYIMTFLILDDTNNNFVRVSIFTVDCKPLRYIARIIMNNHAVTELVELTLDDLLKEISKN